MASGLARLPLARVRQNPALFGRKAGGFPGCHASLHVGDVGETHVLQKLGASGSIRAKLTGGDDLA